VNPHQAEHARAVARGEGPGGPRPSLEEEERFEALLLQLQVHREDTPSVDAVLDHFAATSARRLNCTL